MNYSVSVWSMCMLLSYNTGYFKSLWQVQSSQEGWNITSLIVS